MTEKDRPTTPGTIDAASSRGDAHERDTIPAPPPPPEHAPASDSAITPAVPMRLGDDAAGESLEIETLPDGDVDTWRPPPPPPVPGTVEVAPAGTSSASRAEAGSSIAPRELAQRPAAPVARNSRTAFGLVFAVVLFGAGAIALQRGARSAHKRSDEPTLAAASQAAAPTEREALEAPPPVVPAHAPSAAVDTTPDPAAIAGSPEPTNAPASSIALAATADRSAAAASPRATRPRAARETSPGDLPEAPSREAIAKSLNDLRSAIALCTDGRNGVAELDMTIQGSGAVGHVLVGGDFAGTPQGSCIARTLRKARFAPFQKAKFRVLYQLML